MKDIFEKYRRDNKALQRKSLRWRLVNYALILIVIVFSAINIYRYIIFFSDDIFEKNKILPQDFPVAINQDDLFIVIFDVGLGDAALIITPNKKTILIDAGESEYPDIELKNNILDAGRKIILPFLWKYNITRIDYAIATNWWSQNYGGFIEILKKIATTHFYTPEFRNLKVTDNHKNLEKTILQKDINHTKITDDTEINISTDVYCKILQPMNETLKNSIDNSELIVYLKYKDNVFLFDGIINNVLKTSVLENYGAKLRSNFLRLSNCGISQPTHREFLEIAAPDFVVFSGIKALDKTLHLKRNNLIKLLTRKNIKYYPIEKYGNIYIISNGKDLKILDKDYKSIID